MAERTAEECRLMLAEYWAKESGFEFKLDEHSKPVYFFKLKPKVTSHFPDITDSNWLDEIEDMLRKHRRLLEAKLTWCFDQVSFLYVLRFAWDIDKDNRIACMKKGQGKTRNLARARCLCKVIEEGE